jgi:hypothetical protein
MGTYELVVASDFFVVVSFLAMGVLGLLRSGRTIH